MARVVLAVNDIAGVVLDVQASTTRNGKVKYDVSFSDGQTYSTFKRDVAERAAALKGQQGTVLRVETSQNGQYTNHDLAEVNPQGAPAVGGTGLGAPSLIPAPAQAAVQVGAPAISVAPPRDFAAETRGKVRHGAIIAGLEAATRTSSGESDPELFDRATKFAQAIEAYVFGELGQAAPAPQAAPVVVSPPTPAPEPVTVEGLVESGLVQVGTSGLPWAQNQEQQVEVTA